MAAGIMAAPGTERGPCEGGCEHRDCATTRRWAESDCWYCDEPIGYEVRFYSLTMRDAEGRRRLVHARCEEEE